MWQLPALSAGSNAVRLPITLWAARHWTAAAASDDAAACARRVRRTLCEEPSLCLWAACFNPAWSEAAPAGLPVIVDWFVPRLPELLCQLDPVPLSASEPFPAWLANVRALAVRYGVDPSDQDPPIALDNVGDWHRLLGSPAAWLEAVGGPDAGGKLPVWLRGASPAWRGAGGGADDAEPAARRAYQRWSDIASTSDHELLPPVWARLYRLRTLEADFAGQLSRAKLAALKELAYGASHEINNPLANIATRAQTLLAAEPDVERRRKLATIAAQAFRAHEMISDLMLFARPPELRRTTCDVGRLAQSIVSELAAEAEFRGVALVGPSEYGLTESEVDPTQLSVALRALIRNALESIDGAGRIAVEVRRVGDRNPKLRDPSWVVLSVEDTGPGISAAVREHLFDPFFSGREAGRGLGFGLTKCWRIVTDHGGKMEVVDPVAGGARFEIWLPAHEPSASADGR